uniref:Receptor expression-enhancing protein n=1 Tax=Rhabditophanes sp. KR3021 TaxID=114890 RepID=A0AC35TUZ5_9BILA
MADLFYDDIQWIFSSDHLIIGKIFQIFSAKFRIKRDHMTKGFLLFLCCFTANPDTGVYVSNFVLLIPALMFSIFGRFSKHKVDNDSLLAYWTIVSILWFLDEILVTFSPFYYLIKVLLIAGTYLRPISKGPELTKWIIRKTHTIGFTVDYMYKSAFVQNAIAKDSDSEVTCSSSLTIGSSPETWNLGEEKTAKSIKQCLTISS